MKKLRFRFDGVEKQFVASSHAQLFRDFFEYWKEHNLTACIEGTFNSGLRLSSKELYEGNVIKKKNLFICEYGKDKLYVITHITPAAMDKGIINFLDAVGAEILEPPITESDKQKLKKLNEQDDDEPALEEVEEVDEKEDVQKNDSNHLNDVIQKLSGGKNVTLSTLVKKKMKERDSEIKNRTLAKAND